MTNTNRVTGNLQADLFTLEDESNPGSSRLNTIWPTTILDQVYDNLSPTNKTLREIIEDLKQDIITGGRGNIIFPVTSVNNRTGNVIIDKEGIGLGNVDNTADKDKPLSDPQREAINKILKNYDFDINLSDLYDHLMDTNNPHGVDIDQLNKNEELAKFVQDYIARHNYSGDRTVHIDIRRSLSTLWLLVDEHIADTKERLEELLDTLLDHLDDTNPHEETFKKKEDVENKVTTFDNIIENDHKHYASTRAIVEFVARELDKFRDTLPDVKTWVQDIFVIDTREQLPEATKDRLRTSYIIRNGLVSHDEIAICRTNDDGTYYWDISQLGSYSKFDPQYFIDSPDGLTINMDNLKSEIDGVCGDSCCIEENLDCEFTGAFRTPVEFSLINLTEAIFDQREHVFLNAADVVYKCNDEDYEVLVNETIRQNVDKAFNDDRDLEIMSTPFKKISYDEDKCHCIDLYEGITTTEIDRVVDAIFKDESDVEINTYPLTSLNIHNTVSSIHIVTGTMDGYIRYYINDDMTTMSENVRVAGLKRLAFLEYVTESEIWDKAIQENHIRDNAIRTRHIHEMSVTPDKISCTNGFIIGNTENTELPISNEVSLLDLANILRPLLGGWPDPNIPGGNPYFEQFAVQISHPHLWKPSREYNLGDYSYGMRFKGKISCLPNMPLKIVLTNKVRLSAGHRIIDSGGSWLSQNKPEIWTTLNGSNTSAGTYAVITMDTDGIYFESVSEGDRMDAEFDIWIKYIKKAEYDNSAPELENGGYVIPAYNGEDIGTGVVNNNTSNGTCDCDHIFTPISINDIADLVRENKSE